MYPARYNVQHFILRDAEHDAIMKYDHVRVDLSKDFKGNIPGQTELFNDYIASHTEYNKDMTSISFYYLKYILVGEEYRRQGYGTTLMNHLIGKADSENVPILLDAAHTDELTYNRMKTSEDVRKWLYDNVVPFYESLGFGDTNQYFHLSEHVPMIYPIEEAHRVNCIPNDLF